MTKIEPETLRQLHNEFNNLLHDYGINAKSVNIKIYVSDKQFIELKGNFPKSIHSELAVLEKGDYWVVELLRWPYLEEDE